MALSPKSPGNSKPPGLTADEKRILAAIDIDRALICGERLTMNEWLVFTLLLRGAGRPVLDADMTEWLWGHDPDGGPEMPEATAYQYILKLRRRLRPLGGRISRRAARDGRASVLHLPGFYGS